MEYLRANWIFQVRRFFPDFRVQTAGWLSREPLKTLKKVDDPGKISDPVLANPTGQATIEKWKWKKSFCCDKLNELLSFPTLNLSLFQLLDTLNAQERPPGGPCEKEVYLMALALNIGKCTLLGNYRENNEDAIEVKQYPDLTLCLVADGMGGQAAGEIASKRATEVIPRELKKNLTQATTSDEVKRLVRKAVVQANDEIIAMGALDRDLKNMGTTVVIAVWRKADELFITGVGDSRAYMIRDNEIKQLTVDHSLAQALVEARTISAEEARGHRFKNVLWKYLGTKEVGEGPEVLIESIQPGDRILLCTDGLSGVVADDQVLKCIQEHTDMQKCAEALGQLALDSGSRDNVSCIVIEVAEAR
jgi:protein phosphatase